MKFRFKPAAAAVAMALSATAATHATAGLTVEGSGGTGTTLTLKYEAAVARTDSLFVAAVVGGSKVYFIDENGKIQSYQSGQTTPYRFRQLAPNTLNTLFTMTVPATLDGTVDLYTAFGVGGGDVLGTGSTALDLTTLEHASVQAGPRGASYVAKGKVVDAAASGAVVCIDANFNRKCDSNEASATAGADGTFELTTTDTEAVRNPMIAVTSAGYVLEAPAGYFSVISPLTTLVQNEIEVDGGNSVTKALKSVAIESGVSADMLTADYVAAGAASSSNTNALAAEGVARLLSLIWKQVASETGLANETSPRRRAAIVQYSRNLMYKNGWVLHEALNQSGMDAAQAFTRIASIRSAVLTDNEREGKLDMLGQQRYRPEWETVRPADVYPGHPWAAMTYDTTTNRISFSLSEMNLNGKLLQMDKSDTRYSTTAALAALTSLTEVQIAKQGGTYTTTADGEIVMTANNKRVENLTSLEQLDLDGKTFKLSELLGFSTSVYAIPDEYNISVTFQSGDKLWREHHDRTSIPLSTATFSTKASGVASMDAYIQSKNSELSSYATFSDYEVYFKPSDTSCAACGGEMWAYNKATATRFKVGTYATRTENGIAYVFVEALTLKGVTGATPTTVIYHDAATSEIKYLGSWRSYVMHCLCWQRKFNLSAAQRVMDALKAVNSVLITAATTTSSTGTMHSMARKGTGEKRTINLVQELTPQEAELIKLAVCGECAGGNCGACPIGNVLGLR